MGKTILMECSQKYTICLHFVQLYKEIRNLNNLR
jgi:hypothetical protein